MTALRDLAARNGAADDLGAAADQLGALLDLPSVGFRVLEAKLFGHDSRAAVEIVVSRNQEREVLRFDSVREMAKHLNLATEVVACTGAVPKLSPRGALEAVGLVRKIAEREAVFSDNEIAAEWGTAYLVAAETHDVDMSDQLGRFRAFVALAQHDPFAEAHLTGASPPRAWCSGTSRAAAWCARAGSTSGCARRTLR